MKQTLLCVYKLLASSTKVIFKMPKEDLSSILVLIQKFLHIDLLLKIIE